MCLMVKMNICECVVVKKDYGKKCMCVVVKKDWIVVWDLEDYVGNQWIWKHIVKLEDVAEKQQFESLKVLAFHPELYVVFVLI